MVWVGGGEPPQHTYSVCFTDIMMHAVASASDCFPRPSIYMQLDGVESPDDEDSDGAAPEVRLVPSDPGQSARSATCFTIRCHVCIYSLPQFDVSVGCKPLSCGSHARTLLNSV